MENKTLKREILASWQGFCSSVNSSWTKGPAAITSPEVRDLSGFTAPDPNGYDCAESFALDWAAYHWLRKWPDFPGSTQKLRKDKAVSSWTAAEMKCRQTNHLIRLLKIGDLNDLLTCPLGVTAEGRQISATTVFLTARRKISLVLGEFGKRKALASCRWSSGATATHRRGTPLSQKMSDQISVTNRALPHLRWVLKKDIHWSASLVGCEPSGPMSLLPQNFSIVRGNRYVVVPKSALTDRSICAEPTGNAFLQQGVGRYIRSRLKRFGVNLDDQSLAQDLAGKAYHLGLSTLDLESASDTISIELVKFLLPDAWFTFLDDLRSPVTIRDNKPFVLEKFSSMGNAFTFELESLIFWSLLESLEELLSAYPRRPTSVYGDDLICSRAVSGPLIAVLRLCGFTTNKTKSFIDGPFFESCGKHYWRGIDVTPPMLTSAVNNLPEVIRAWNKVLRFSFRLVGNPYDPRILRLCSLLRKHQRAGPFQPYSEDLDVGFISTDFVFKTCPNRGTFIYKALEFVPKRFPSKREDAVLAYKLRHPGHSNPHPRGWASEVPGRGHWVPTSRWYPQTLFGPKGPKSSDFLP